MPSAKDNRSASVRDSDRFQELGRRILLSDWTPKADRTRDHETEQRCKREPEVKPFGPITLCGECHGPWIWLWAAMLSLSLAAPVAAQTRKGHHLNDAAWTVGRDPRTCAQAQFLGLLYRQAPEDLRARLQQAERQSQGRLSAREVLDFELAIVDALDFDGRDADAEIFIQQRMSRTVDDGRQRYRPSDDVARDEAARRFALQVRLARLHQLSRPAEAERQLQQVLAARVASFDALRKALGRQSGSSGQAAAPRYEDGLYEQLAQRERVELIAPYYRRTGQAAQAQKFYEQSLDWLRHQREAMGASERSRNGLYQSDIDEQEEQLMLVRAEIAVDAGRFEDAEALFRSCCLAGRFLIEGEARTRTLGTPALPGLIRLLLARGRRDEAGQLALRLAHERARGIEDSFSCLQWPPVGGNDAALRRAQDAAQAALASADTDSLLEGSGKGIGSAGGAGAIGGGGMGAGRSAAPAKMVPVLDEAAEAGLLLLASGLADDARDVLTPILGLQRVIFGANHPGTLRTLAGLAAAERQRGQLQQAAELGADWLAGSGSFLADRLWNVSEQSRRAFFHEDHVQVEQLLDTLVAAGRADAAEQVLALSLGRKGLLTHVAGQIQALARASTDANTRQLMVQLQLQRQEWARWAFRDAADSPAAQQVRRQLDELEATLAAAVRPGRAAARSVSPQQVLQALRPDEVLIDFQVFHDPAQPSRERMVAVVGQAPQRLTLVSWPDLAELRAAGHQLRQAMQRSDAATVTAAGERLARLWWAPLEPHLNGAHRLVVVLDGLLNVLPLRALKDSQGRLLIETYGWTQLASGRDLLDPAGGPRGTTALVLGAPDYGPGGTAAPAARVTGRELGELFFAPLPGTLQEARSVTSTLGSSQSTLLTGERADKAALLWARSPSVLHLATHGFFLDEATLTSKAQAGLLADPMQSLARSGLALAHANLGLRRAGAGGADNGILTALEAVSLDLRGTRLVVLSACETALGQTPAGDGVYGLIRAFHEAGAQAVLGTLWPVADEATSEFMQRFYRRLVRGEPAPMVLQATQLEFAADPRWAHPRYWAGFLMTGRF